MEKKKEKKALGGEGKEKEKMVRARFLRCTVGPMSDIPATASSRIVCKPACWI